MLPLDNVLANDTVTGGLLFNVPRSCRYSVVVKYKTFPPTPQSPIVPTDKTSGMS